MSLRDQLKKAKLLDAKRAKQLEHEERVHRKKAGRAGIERAAAARQAELDAAREREREASARAQAEREQLRRQAAERAACEEILRREVVRPSGGAKWFFERPDGVLPFLEVDQDARRQLAAGALSVVALAAPDAHVYGLIATRHAERIAAVFSDRVVWARAPNPQ